MAHSSHCSDKPETQHPGADCCHTAESSQADTVSNCCETPKDKIDWLLWGSLTLVIVGYCAALFGVAGSAGSWVSQASHTVQELMNTMWLSLVFAFVFVGVLSQIPQSLVMKILGRGGSVNGLVRATCAGILMDLCSHGILMVGMKLYQKGASLGQTMAFLIASPWNSLSLTIILFALIGWQWTLAFIGLSMILAFTSGWVFDQLVRARQLPTYGQEEAVNSPLADNSLSFGQQVKNHWQAIRWNRELLSRIVNDAFSGSKIVVKWLLFGVVLASIIRASMSPEMFQQWLGPTALGLAVTLVAATVIEVCSEGSAPIAADILNRTSAPGNSFAFLMAGVATDYTEVMVIKDTMKSWKVALFLPLITLPQVIVIAALLNGLG